MFITAVIIALLVILGIALYSYKTQRTARIEIRFRIKSNGKSDSKPYQSSAARHYD